MARKATVKKAAQAVDNTVKAAAQAAETTAKKAASAVKKVEDVFVQYGEKEVKVADVVDAAKAAFKEANGRKAIKTLQLYVKPEESAAYYVINSEFTGKVDL
jgi:hypothetical protein